MKRYLWIYGVLFLFCLSGLSGCGKKEGSFEVKMEMRTSNYSCRDSAGQQIYGDKMFYEIQQTEEMTEGERLDAIAGAVEKLREAAGEENEGVSAEVIEVEAVWTEQDGREKTYLLRGKELETLVTIDNGREVYTDRKEIK